MRINRVKLIAEMARQDMKVGELAELAGTSRATISSARGGKSCTTSTALKIAQALGIDIAKILDTPEPGDKGST